MAKRSTNNDVYVIILVGGKGKRLRPLSTDARPKAFLSVTKNGQTMFRNTVDRISRLARDGHIVVVANKLHASLVKMDMPGLAKRDLLLEPVSRNTAPAVALAAAVVAGRNKDAVIAVLPTDHYIFDADKQLACLQKGVDFIRKSGSGIVVIGLKPRHPSTQFGYVRVKGPAFTKASAPRRGSRIAGIRRVERFVEKPDLATAKKYCASGNYLWNSGIFIFKARYFMDAVKQYAPEIFRALDTGTITAAAYHKLPDISLDYAIMEKVRRIYCVEGSYGWDDMGNFKALKNVLRREGRQFVEKDGKVVEIL